MGQEGNKHGIFPVAGTDNADRKLDLIFIHGLGGDAFSTWQYNNEQKYFWPKSLANEFPDIGVWTIGYGATVSQWIEDVMPMEDRAENLLNHLSVIGIGSKPLVFVAHSMGGLIGKYILIQASQSNDKDYQQIAENCLGVVFLAVPHDGSGWSNLLDYARFLIRGNKILKQLAKDDSALRQLDRNFSQLVQRKNLACYGFFETEQVRYRKKLLGFIPVPVGIKIVSESSASSSFLSRPATPLPANHISICKLKSKRDQLYENMNKIVLAYLSLEEGRQAYGATVPQALIQVHTTPVPKDKISPYIAGPAVTPPQFVGREYEIRALHSAVNSGESTSIIGNRRIGKSSILATFGQELRQDNYSVTALSGQNGEGANLQQFLQAIVQHSVIADISADEAANQLVQWADIQQQQTQKKPVILVDECEAIIQHCQPRFWERVRGASDKIVWIFASRIGIDQLYRNYHHGTSPFENQLKTLWIALLDEDAAEKIIQKGGFSEQHQQLMRTWAGRHPYFLQLFGSILWLAKPAINQTQVLDEYKMSAKRHLDDLWWNLSEKSKPNY
ncbi:MAG: AAA family ATPase [Thiolinea sp.]